MDNPSLLAFLMNHSPLVQGPAGQWKCHVDEVEVYCLTDEQADRMRFMAVVGPAADLGAEALKAMLEANFHSALDARLAVHNEGVWSLFVSPLSALNETLAENGLTQVVTLAKNAAHGDLSSGPWKFVGG